MKSNQEILKKITTAYAAIRKENKISFTDAINHISNMTGISQSVIRKEIDNFIMNEVGDILKAGDLQKEGVKHAR